MWQLKSANCLLKYCAGFFSRFGQGAFFVRKYKNMKLLKTVLLLFALVFPSISTGKIISIGYGLGAESHIKPNGTQKILNLRWHHLVLKQLCYSVDGGIYFDNRRNISSGFGFVQVGPRIHPVKGVYVFNTFGPGFVSKTGPLLGGHFQFGIDLGAGVTEAFAGVDIGLLFKHISSAGINQPNHGRNYWMLNVGWAFK